MVDYRSLIEIMGQVLDVAGVVAIVGGIGLVSFLALARRLRGAATMPVYQTYRQGIGRAILLGLEILVAADIIRTVAVEPSFRSVGVLAVIVLIRTFLSTTLELEIEGRWPWQPRPAETTRSTVDRVP